MKDRSVTLNISIKRSTANVFSAIFTFPEKIREIGENAEKGFQPYSELMKAIKLNFDIPIRLIGSGENYQILMTIYKPKHYSESLFEKKLIEIQEAMEKMKNIIEAPKIE